MSANDEMLNMSLKDIEKMSCFEKKEYFNKLRDYCIELGKKSNNNMTFTQRMMAKVSPLLRNFEYEIVGEENVPKDGCLFMCNHSNTHDAFTTAEVLTKVGVPATFLAAIEGLSPIELALFKGARSTMIDRTDRASATKGLYDFSSRIINGDTGLIFGEGTWNLHPYKPMQNIKVGCVKVAAITKKPIVPVIYEYIEVPDFVNKEKDLYCKCIVKFDKPIFIDSSLSLIEQSRDIQKKMEEMRRILWKENDVYRENIEEVNPEVYVNHTWLKKFGTPLFYFDSETENKILFSDGKTPVENEYYIDENGDFKPGIILKKTKVKGIY